MHHPFDLSIWNSPRLTAAIVNYVSAIYFIVTLILTIYWFVRGKATFRRRDVRHTEAEAGGFGHEGHVVR